MSGPISDPLHERQRHHGPVRGAGERGSEVSGRVSGRVKDEFASDLLRGATRGETRDDSSPKHTAAGRPDQASPAQVPARPQDLVDRLTDVDWSIIETLTVVRMASGNQLQRLHFPAGASGSRMARRRLARLTDLRVLARLDRQIGGIRGGSQGHTYALDTNGQRLAQTRHLQTVRRPTPSDQFVDHTIAVTEIYVVLHEHRDVEVEAFQGEPDCWRRYTGRAGRELTLRPDAYAHWYIEDWELLAFFEVDRATEHPGRIARKAEQYVLYWRTGSEQDANGVFPSVVWVTPNQRRAAVVSEALDGLDDGRELFQVVTDETLLAFVTSAGSEMSNEENEISNTNNTRRGGDP